MARIRRGDHQLDEFVKVGYVSGVTFHVERPGSNWLRIVTKQPLVLPYELQTLPGISVREPQEQGQAWICDVAQTTWCLPPVRAFLKRYRVDDPWQPRASIPWHVAWTEPQPSSGIARRQLLAHQWAAVSHFQAWAGTDGIPGGILADQVGLGKTTTAIHWASRVAQHYPDRPIVILGPKYLTSTWRRELEANEESAPLVLKGTTPRLLEPSKWIFLHYDIIHAWWSQVHLTRPCVVLLDEAHLMRNSRTRRAKGAALAFGAAPHRMALTGTPLLNRVGELHGLLTLLTGAWTWGAPGLFRMRYAGAYVGEHGLVDVEATHTEELQARLGPFYLRRTEQDVGVELPETSRSVVALELDEGGHDEFAGHSARQVADAILNRRASRQSFEWLLRLRKRSARRKISTTVEIVQSYLAQGLACVVFCWQRETCETIAGKLGTAAHFVHGGLSQVARDGLVADFQAGGSALVATYDSLGTGVTLNRARIAVLHDLDYVPATMLQAEGRVTGGLRRKATTRSVYIVDPSGIDPIVLRLLRIKGTLIDEVAADSKAMEIAELLAREL